MAALSYTFTRAEGLLVYHDYSLAEILTKSILMMRWHYEKLMLFIRMRLSLKHNNDFSEKLSKQKPIELCSNQHDKSLTLHKSKSQFRGAET